MICVICGSEFRGKGRQKYCSDKCRHEGWKKYLRKRYAEKVLKERQEFENSSTRYTKLSHRKFLKDNSIKIEWTEEMSKKMTYLVENQQFIPRYRKKSYCEVCGISKEKHPEVILYKHHIKYNPQEIVTLCSTCHAFLHHSLLKRRKCNGY